MEQGGETRHFFSIPSASNLLKEKCQYSSHLQNHFFLFQKQLLDTSKECSKADHLQEMTAEN